MGTIFLIITFIIFFTFFLVMIGVTHASQGYFLLMNERDYMENLFGALLGGLILGFLRAKLLGFENPAHYFFIFFFLMGIWIFITRLSIHGLYKNGTLYKNEFYLSRN